MDKSFGMVTDGEIEYHRIGALDGLFGEQKKTLESWNSVLKDLNVEQRYSISTKELFEFAKWVFEKKFGKKIDLFLIQKYVASNNGKKAIPYNQASRIFTTEKSVFIDTLIEKTLYNYIVLTYMVNHFLNDKNENIVKGICFYHYINMMVLSFRAGRMNSDNNQAQLLEDLHQFFDEEAVFVIERFYLGALLFVIFHEFSHIVLKHSTNDKEKWENEFAADKMAFITFLEIINKKYDSPFPYSEIFQDFLSSAPIIFFLMYEDLYFISNRLFGEQISGSHPKISDRIKRLINIRDKTDLDIDFSKSDDFLNEFWNASDYFREETIYKFKNGKLNELIRKGKCEAIDMHSKEDFNDAFLLDEQIYDYLKKISEEEQLDTNLVDTIWETGFCIDSDIISNSNSIIFYSKKKTISVKTTNIQFNLKSFIEFVVDTGLSVSVPKSKIEIIKLSLLIFCHLVESCSIILTEEHAKILLEVYRQSKDDKESDYESIISKTGVSNDSIDDLCNLKCLRKDDNKIFLNELIIIPGDLIKENILS